MKYEENGIEYHLTYQWTIIAVKLKPYGEIQNSDNYHLHRMGF